MTTTPLLPPGLLVTGFRPRGLGIAFRALGLLLSFVCVRLTAASPDVLVYGGTPGGIMAAIAAARGGASVLLVEPTHHVGGLTTGGLTHTDAHTYEGTTGLYHEFLNRVEDYYRQRYGPDSQQLRDCDRGMQAEAYVNELVFEQMLRAEKAITVKRGLHLTHVRVAAGNQKRTLQAASFASRDGSVPVEEITAKIFIDGSYEGDLMAKAGVEYRVGREGRAEYGESLAPEVADGQLQAYNFRLIATKNPEIRVPVAKPEGYRREDFIEIVPLLEDGRIKRLFAYYEQCVFKAQIPNMPNGKYDLNDYSRGLVRLSMPGENLAWPDGDAAERERIFRVHLRYNVGLLWFLQHDEAVPEKFRTEALEWGWCRDEFTDNGHLPWQLYVREARRMVGQRVFVESDTIAATGGDARAVLQSDSVAFGEYGLNCHGTFHEGPRYGGKHTGEFYRQIAPYQIPYGIIVPKDVGNLLVPVAISASHVGFCALRYEAVWMGTGQAAGVAARLALRHGSSVQDVSPIELRRLLHAEGAGTIYVSDIPVGHPLFASVQWLAAMGGLHGLATPKEKYGERGATILGQYHRAFPRHEFEPEGEASPTLIDRWIALLPAARQKEARISIGRIPAPLTRGKVVEVLHDGAQ